MSHQRTIDAKLAERLSEIALQLIDQDAACVVVPPQRPSSGFWFGGGNLIQDRGGTLWLIGRYRNQGDSRTGLGAGERGLELTLFRSDDQAASFEVVHRWSKADLDIGDRKVLSIEGSALFLDPRRSSHSVQLFVSTEKDGIGYPDPLQSYLKPGTGVWTIDRIAADSLETLSTAKPETVLASSDPRFMHVKDPFIGSHQGQPCLMFCTHPFCWTSSNTGFVPLSEKEVSMEDAVLDFFPRGFTWDVAMSRGTAVVPLPKVGEFCDRDLKLLFYDGGECVRNLDEHQSAVSRPRGYSCEELGGLACYHDDDLQSVQRLSILSPLFVSPHGTGCSRYVDVLVTDSHYIATWQQSQPDGSQPLVMNQLPVSTIERILNR